jgi:SAM-dependent methyltransferase
MNPILRRIFGLYRHSRALSFLVERYREAKQLRLRPRETTDDAHLSGTWNFDNAVERRWQKHLLEVVATATRKERWDDVLEIGCSEGVFTAELAQLCTSVRACDISPIALERAKTRCAGCLNVHFDCLDAAVEDIRGQYDIVFMMDVLWFVVGRKQRLKIIPNAVQCIRDGGFLVFSDSRMPRFFRHPFWSPFFSAGADQWAKVIASTPGLNVVHREIYPPKGQGVPGWWEKLFVVYRKEPTR